ncbi:MAG: hypothetical protein LBR44_04725 [Clostridiales Family XIII bacterium]|jgi:hypothetical protein|nr:hypothetical protein [Clostridiales Family XIII bacterium]
MMEDNFEESLKQRLELASDPSYEGEKMTRSQVIALLVVCFGLPMVLMLVGWWLK